ncbi:MAG: GTPase ObgE, partial [Bacteroidales bacterium]
LGLRFLRHIERNSVLLFMIPITSPDPHREYQTLLNELEKYNPVLLLKKRIIAITKVDTVDENELLEAKQKFADLSPIFISSITGYGIQELKDKLWTTLNSE